MDPRVEGCRRQALAGRKQVMGARRMCAPSPKIENERTRAPRTKERLSDKPEDYSLDHFARFPYDHFGGQLNDILRWGMDSGLRVSASAGPAGSLRP